MKVLSQHKSIGVGIGSTFQQRYWYWYRQYFFCQSIVIGIDNSLTSTVSIPAVQPCYTRYSRLRPGNCVVSLHKQHWCLRKRWSTSHFYDSYLPCRANFRFWAIARFRDCIPVKTVLLSACDICDGVVQLLTSIDFKVNNPTTWLHIITDTQLFASQALVHGQDRSTWRKYGTVAAMMTSW